MSKRRGPPRKDRTPGIWEYLTERREELGKTQQEIADTIGATRIIIKSDNGSLLLGILKQYRYWTCTRARLTAIELLRDKIIGQP